MQKNLQQNAFGQVISLNVAVSRAAGTAPLFFQREVPDGVATFIRSEPPTSSVECTTVSLDQMLKERGELPPLVMKVDVEGWEKAVLDGAGHLLASPGAPVLLLEMEDAHFVRVGSSRREIRQVLSRLGYAAFQPKGRRWIMCHDLDEVRVRNFFWLRPSNPIHRERAREAGILELSAGESIVNSRQRVGARG